MMIKKNLCKDEWYFDTDLSKKSDDPKKHFSRNLDVFYLSSFFFLKKSKNSQDQN